MSRSCDSARRAGNTHLLNQRESQAQSEDLQAEMRTDMRGLEEKLAAGALTLCLSAMQESTGAEREGALTVDKRVGIGNQGLQGNAGAGVGA